MRGLINRALAYFASHHWNGYGSGEQIISHTSTNKYTVPGDGIIRVWCNYRSGNYVQVTISNSDGTNPQEFHQASGGTGQMSIAVPVFKGQKVWTIANNGLYNYVTFIPYKNMGGVLPDLITLPCKGVA